VLSQYAGSLRYLRYPMRFEGSTQLRQKKLPILGLQAVVDLRLRVQPKVDLLLQPIRLLANQVDSGDLYVSFRSYTFTPFIVFIVNL